MGPGRAQRHRGDDLEGRYHGDTAERPVRGGHLPGPRDGGREILLAERAEGGRFRVAVQGDQPVTGEDELAAAGELHTGGRDRDPVGKRAGRPETGTGRHHPDRFHRRERGDRGRVGPRVTAVHRHDGRPGDLGGCGHGERHGGIASRREDRDVAER